jgi:hypothetical protein
MLSNRLKLTVAVCFTVMSLFILTFGAVAFADADLHRGGVEEIFHAGGYTYVSYSEEGTTRWAAFLEDQRVRTGDEVEFAKSPPMINFTSKSLGRTFKEIEFAPVVRIYRNGKQLEREEE